MAIPITNTMRQRMKSQFKGRQPQEERYYGDFAGPITDHFRPNAVVHVTRGAMRRHHFAPYPRELTPNQRRAGENRWRGDWDEKYRFLGQHGEEGSFHIVPDTEPPVKIAGGGGREMPERLQGPVRMPHLKQINVSNSLDKNGVGTASVVIQNAEWEEHTGVEMIYHLLKQGFFSPYYGGDDLGLGANEHERLGLSRATPGDRNEAFNQDDFVIDAGSYSAINGALYDANGKQITGLLVPNRHVEIWQGYGDELQQTFTGLIDSVEITSNPRQITLNCSDFGRVLTDTAFLKQTVQPGNWPPAFVDRKAWSDIGPRKTWPDKGAPANSIGVREVTDIVGTILGWAGFQFFKSPKVGRIGTDANVDGDNKNNKAVFEGEAFGMGSYFIDGINRVKEILGFHFYMTPEYWASRPNSARFRDPDVYDGEYSRFNIGLPNFVPPNIWMKEPVVEQYHDDETLINANITYDIESIRNSIYIFNTKPEGGGTVGMHARHGLAAGMPRVIFYDLKENMGGITMSQTEIEIMILMTYIQTLMFYAKGTITVPGHPGAKINDQCDILERSTGTWRRFFIWGFDSQMTLGPNSSYRTTFQVSNMDNALINRYKKAIRERGGWRRKLGYQGSIRETNSPR